MAMTIPVHTAASLLMDDRYVIAEDWPSPDLAAMAAQTAATILRPDSGYAGSRDLDIVANFVAGLLEISEDSGYACGLLLADVVDT
jgi:hypothetical protein